MTDVPDWAIERAWTLSNKERPHKPLSRDDTKRAHMCLAFARYIAEHEEPPVDPLRIEAREICQQNGFENPFGAEEALALAALRRGLELARTKSEAGE